MRTRGLIKVLGTAIVLTAVSCGPLTDVSMGVGVDSGYDVAPGYVNVNGTWPFSVVDPVYSPGYWGGWNSAPWAPRPVTGPAIRPRPPYRPGPIVSPGNRPTPAPPTSSPAPSRPSTGGWRPAPGVTAD